MFLTWNMIVQTKQDHVFMWTSQKDIETFIQFVTIKGYKVALI
jgi:hypothetical protein